MPETTEFQDHEREETDEQPQSSDRPVARDGLVVALAPDYFEVAVDGVVYLCTARGRLRRAPRRPVTIATNARRSPERSTFSNRRLSQSREQSRANEEQPTEPERPTTIATGDQVKVTLLDASHGVIEDIAPRRNALSRARSELETEHVMMANVDLAVLVFAVREPEPHLRLLDRYLVLCERAGIPTVILFNKVDLGASEEIERSIALYASLGYPTLRTSATTGAGVAELRAWLVGRSSLLTGPSGVGKSSLINVLLPDAAQRIGEISEATGKGRHTTTGARLLPLPEGGWLADTAGIRELALWNAPADTLASYFVELRPIADDCEYEDCSHAEGAEGCALQAALADGRISPSRWESFERLLEEAREKERPRWLPAGR